MRSIIATLGLWVVSGCFSEPMDGESDSGSVAETGGGEAEGDVEVTLSESAVTSQGSSSTGADAGSSSTGWGWDTEFGTTTTGDPTEGVAAICGDGRVEGGEVCDDGPDPELLPGACAPNCRARIETRRIQLSASATRGDLGPDPVATADGLCSAGFRALFADGRTRRATTVPNTSSEPVDWVLRPYTAYVNGAGALLWVTDEVALLGVRQGVAQPLRNPIVPFEQNPPAALTGLTPHWTTLELDDCQGWSSAAPGDLHNAGIPWIPDDGGFLNNGAVGPCDAFDHVYCVES